MYCICQRLQPTARFSLGYVLAASQTENHGFVEDVPRNVNDSLYPVAIPGIRALKPSC